MGLAGGEERIGRAGERSRRIEFDEVARVDPDVLFVACCGFTIERARVDLEGLRGGRSGKGCGRFGRGGCFWWIELAGLLWFCYEH